MSISSDNNSLPSNYYQPLAVHLQVDKLLENRYNYLHTVNPIDILKYIYTWLGGHKWQNIDVSYAKEPAFEL